MKKSIFTFLLYGGGFVYQAIQLINVRTNYDLILLNHEYNIIYLILTSVLVVSLVHFVFRDKFIEAYQVRDKVLSIFAEKDEQYDRFIKENAKENYYKVSKASYIITIILAITISLLSIRTIIQNINSLINNFSTFLIYIIITIVFVTLALTSHILCKKRERTIPDDNTLKIFSLLLIANISIVIFNLQSISDLSL